jgi:hypothetical protein
MPSPYDAVPCFPEDERRAIQAKARHVDAAAPPPPEPSAYVCSLASAYLLAPENAVEEDVLRALFLQHARAEGIDGDALLEAASARLRAEGLIT